jgi:hypothetical protein
VTTSAETVVFDGSPINAFHFAPLHPHHERNASKSNWNHQEYDKVAAAVIIIHILPANAWAGNSLLDQLVPFAL